MSELTDFRKEKDAYFARDSQSPLTSKQRKSFKGLAYFPENPSLRLDLPVEMLEEEEPVQMVTSTGSVQEYRRWGRVTFPVDGKEAALTIYQDTEMGHLFLPFADGTSGQETYEAGRYMEPQLLEDERVLLDFNYAYSPYCAYNAYWSCPIPPAENRLKVRLEAGEKNFPGKDDSLPT